VVFNSQEEGKILRTAALAIMLIILVVFINILIQYISERGNRKKPGKSGGEVALTLE
jgi:ABC-type phosphate transport system permease subunit